jgi:ABC-type Mn2+/Zn2+ transport system ATPase subunit
LTANVLEVRGLGLTFGESWLCRELSFALPRGAACGIVGPNGAGKTTLLRALCGSVTPRAGSIRWHAPARLGYVPQRDTIDPIHPFTAREVVVMAPSARRLFSLRAPAADLAAADAALAAVDLGAVAEHPYHRLSGGQRQRVLLARALALAPDVVLLDEPTSQLDPVAARSLLELVERLRRERGLTLILVSHDLTLVARRTGHVVALGRGSSAVGVTREVLLPERLAALYGHRFEVLERDGQPLIVAEEP